MQAYGQVFAHVYNLRWGSFAQQVAPKIRAFYESTPVSREQKTLLDLCCGTGQLAAHFLEHGYRVTGVDLSAYMLEYAKENTKPYLETGQAQFIQSDVTDFKLNAHFGLVVSTYDALNHLENENALRKCFQCAAAVADGYFIFDLNTRLGLERWNGMQVDDREDVFTLTRGIYDGHGDKAWTKVSGFLRRSDGLYARFEETAFNTIFVLENVGRALFDTGWNEVYCARIQDLKIPFAEPEKENRVFFVARKDPK